MQFIGAYYKEHVLSLPRKALSKKELFGSSGEIKIERDLFGWKIYSGKNFIECQSEEEARYLKVFLQLGFTEVYVPKEESYLKRILPELERLKARTDEILNFYLETILNRKIRERLKYEVYMEITK
ncbi:MAG: hypothetical protein KG012_20020 [Deltaproteobacteria bacterium]|nr:hypothetical protein [Deltaproteobacteria bacterium]